MNEIIVRLIDVPVDLKGVVKEDSNGDYNVYLNARYMSEQILQTYLHELAHIKLGHLQSDRPVDELEAEAEKETTAILMSETASRLYRG